ncbi:MAG: CsiV family protein [Pseudomonadales bacterium]
MLLRLLIPLRKTNTSSHCGCIVTLLASLVVCLANPAWAEDKRWYQAEIIIAERLDNLMDEEQHPTALVSPVPSGKVLKEYPSIGNQALTQLPSNQHQLTSVKRRLERADAYRVLFHEAWPIAIAKNEPTIWIDVKSGMEQHGHYELEGKVGVSMGRFLHLHTQLHLNKFISEALPADNQLNLFLDIPYKQAQISQRYSMQQKRKMRSKELHYLDHPNLVLLVRFDPYTPKIGPLPRPENQPRASQQPSQSGVIISPLETATNVTIEGQ